MNPKIELKSYNTYNTSTVSIISLQLGKELLKQLLRQLFRIYPGEEKRSLLLTLLGFTWAFGASCGVQFSDALFLLHVGPEQLPLAFVLTAVALICSVFLLLYSSNKLTPCQLYKRMLCIGGFIYACIGITLFFNPTHYLFWFFVKIFGDMFIIPLITCYWNFVDQYFCLKDAKRLYGLISGTLFFGFACAGTLISFAVFNTTTIFFVMATSMLASIAIIQKIQNSLKPVLKEEEKLEVTEKRPSIPLSTIFKMALSSPFTLLLILSCLFTQLLSVVTEFHYMEAFHQYFQSSALYPDAADEQLTLFLGRCTAYISIINLLFSFFIYGRLTTYFGVHNMVLAVPLAFLFIFVPWPFTSPTLFLPIFGFSIVEGLFYSVEDTTFTLLVNSLPSWAKCRIRMIIESFFEPLGMLISASLLLLFQNESQMLGLTLSLITLLITLSLRTRVSI